MKVFGIVGSPKKNGNVDVLVSQVLKGAGSQGTETYTIYLHDMQIIDQSQAKRYLLKPKFTLFGRIAVVLDRGIKK